MKKFLELVAKHGLHKITNSSSASIIHYLAGAYFPISAIHGVLNSTPTAGNKNEVDPQLLNNAFFTCGDALQQKMAEAYHASTKDKVQHSKSINWTSWFKLPKISVKISIQDKNTESFGDNNDQGSNYSK